MHVAEPVRPLPLSMKTIPLTFCILLPLTLLAQSPAASGEFSRQQLTDEFWAEGANFGDFNKDGKMDVVYGQWWFEGPDFTKRHQDRHIEKSYTVKAEDGSEKTSRASRASTRRTTNTRKLPRLHPRLQWRRLDGHPRARLSGRGVVVV